MAPRPAPRLRAVPQQGTPDRALAEAFCRGEHAAFVAIAEPHLDALYTLCLRMTKDPGTAEDLAQETLVKVLRQAHRYDPSRAFRPWLLKVGLNLCRDRLRSPWWRRMLSLDRAVEGESPGPEAMLAASERDRLVRQALSTLPLKYREAVALFHLEDMSYQEMAEVTGQQVPALKQRVRRGRAMLKAAVEKMYPELMSAPDLEEQG